MFRRGAMFYMQDSATGKQTSLRTKDEAEASSLLNARNAAQQQPTLNLHLARAYLTASDPAFVERTWQTVMQQLQSRGKDSSRERYASVFKSPSFDELRNKKLLETTTDDFFAVFKDGKVSIVYFLKRLHNFALSLGWIAIPIVAPYLWPKYEAKDRRGITQDEHQSVLQQEKNAEWKLYLELLWETGAAQSDAVNFKAEDVDPQTRTISYFRQKTGSLAQFTISKKLETVLSHLPTTGVAERLEQPGIDQRGNIMRLAVQHPARLFRREAGGQLSQERQEPLLFFFHAKSVAGCAKNRTGNHRCIGILNVAKSGSMSKELVPILADALRAYYDTNELVEICSLFDIQIELDYPNQKPNLLALAKRLIVEMEHGNHRRLLEALLPSLFVRCSEMIAKTDWERRDFHQEMSGRMEKLRPLLGTQTTPTEIAVPDGKPFTAKSEIRELIEKAEGEVFLVDAYIGITTLDCLRELQHPIKILTGQQKQSIESGFDTTLADFRAEGRTIEVRRHPKLHDRYLIFNERCWLIGGSIKDAGKKALNVIECLDSKDTISADVKKKWDEATIYT